MAEQDQIADELVITLRKPVALGELSFSQLVLREPTAGEWEEFDKLEGLAADIAGVAIVSGVPAPAIKKIGASDFRKARAYVASFLYDAPAIGSTA